MSRWLLLILCNTLLLYCIVTAEIGDKLTRRPNHLKSCWCKAAVALCSSSPSLGPKITTFMRLSACFRTSLSWSLFRTHSCQLGLECRMIAKLRAPLILMQLMLSRTNVPFHQRRCSSFQTLYIWLQSNAMNVEAHRMTQIKPQHY